MNLNKVLILVFVFGVGLISYSGSLEVILSRCCNLGVRWAWDNKTCSRFPSPVQSVATEQQGPCLATIDACCQRNYRERQCTKGHETAKSGRECTEASGVGGSYHKDCCEGCKLGLIAGSMGLLCEFAMLKVALGPPWDSSLTKCCLQAGGLAAAPLHRTTTLAPQTTLPPTTREHTTSRSTTLASPAPNDICALFPGQLCSHICIPDGASFKCTCQPGYRLLPDLKSCLLDQSAPKAPTETSTQSGKDKQCPVGFAFNARTQICDDINECEMNACRMFPYKTCVNTIGSFLCEQTDRENEPSHQCPPGYRFNTEAATCVDINECEEGVHICDSTQYCINTPGGFDCQSKKEFSRYNCPAGYKFNNKTLNCEDVDECQESLSSCSEYEVCRNTAGAYDCDVRCRDGFRFDIRLRSCQDEDECLLGTHDCIIDQETCFNVPGSYQCHQIQPSENNCPPGYEPNHNYTFLCQDIDECKSSFLHTCTASETCINEVGGYRCDPPVVDGDSSTSTEMDEDITDNTIPGSTGTLEPITEPPTTERPLPPSVPPTDPPQRRRNNAQMTPCKQGFRMWLGSGSAESTCEDIDECKEGTACDSTQLCQNTIGSFYCHCRSGYYRDPITRTCQDVNECQTGQHTCTSSQRCDNSPGSYSCIRITGCGTGYTLNTGTGQCEDDDECLFGNHNCHALGPEWECKNTLGSFRCDRALKACPVGLTLAPTGDCRPTCNSGFQFNSRGECIDIDECRQVPGVRTTSVCQSHQRCVNTEGSFRCISEIICPAGYEADANGIRCVDVDECRVGHHCKGNQECINRPGGYVCKCPNGYTISEAGDCEDIDECSRYAGHVCSSNSDCYNTQGSFRCICKTGFEQGQDDQSCKDVDECANQHRICDQTCINTWGSYRCTCTNGFTLGPDGRTCQDVDECGLSQGEFLCTGRCINTHGSFRCSCPEGYQLRSDNRSCQDIDECERPMCRSDEKCLNTRGGFRCNRLICPNGYQREGTDDRCKKIVQCPESDGDCLKQPLTISKNYLSFTSNVRLGSVGYIDMFTMKGPSWPGAVMHFSLDLKDTRAPSGVVKVTKDSFLLRRPSPHQAIISLIRTIPGPQDVELELLMEVYHRGAYAGSALAQVVIVVTAHEF